MSPRLSRSLLLAAALILIVGSHMRLSTELEASPTTRRGDASNSFFGLFVFGAFRSMFIEHLWTRASRHEAEGQVWELVDDFERLIRLDGDNPKIYYIQVRALILDIAQNEVDDTMRWRLYRRALDRLAEGIRRHPDHELLYELAALVHLKIDADRWCARQFRRQRGSSAFEVAVEVAGRRYQLFPESADAFFSFRRLGEETFEWLLNNNRFAQAAASAESLGALEAEGLRKFASEEDSCPACDGGRATVRKAHQNAPRIRNHLLRIHLTPFYGSGRIALGPGILRPPRADTLHSW